MLLLWIIYIGLHIFIFLYTVFMVLSVVKGAPFVPTDKKDVRRMVELAQIRFGEKALDLGSGDGRLLIALARAGAEAHGIEINLLLVGWAKWNIWRAGLSDKAFVQWGSFWGKNLSTYQVVTVFGFSSIMKDLQMKLQRELPAGARVVSNDFKFPGWKVIVQKGDVYLYKV